ncbi:MAG: 4'-phosphopantetheinyl transferase superfamily protein [Planctomycetes bacterium]|nr:4'-phosphopantetheinyl transferase superfamily protein [Planctomycetota bacterium]
MSRPSEWQVAPPARLPEQLGPDEVHVWLVRPDDLEVRDCRTRALAMLAPDERARYDRYRHVPSRDQFLAARMLLRGVLSRYTDQPAADWTFATNQYGRPEIATPEVSPRLRFNLSHTTGLVALATVRECDIGVDVETVNRRNGGVHLAERYFSPSEVRDLLQVPLDRQHREFFDYWTLKEAYIKARGHGLALPLDAFSYHLNEQAAPTISFDAPKIADEPAEWQFGQSWPTAEHRLGLAVRVGRGGTLPVVMLPTTLSEI